MADTKDALGARRWFRRRLGELGSQYPELKQGESQERLREALAQEDTPCQEPRQENHGDGH